MIPRKYQAAIIAAVVSALQVSPSTAIEVCTAAGKTVIASHVADAFIPKGRILFLVHRDELVQQSIDKLHAVTGIMPAVEKAERFSYEESVLGKPQILVASIQSLNSTFDGKLRMERFDPAEFSLMIVDEAAHAVSPSWKRVIEYFQQNAGLRTVFMSAAFDRLDGRGLAEICSHVAYRYTAREAIADGYIVPLTPFRVRIPGLNFAKVSVSGSDLNQEELEAAMLVEEPLHGVAHATIEFACGLERGALELLRDDPERIEKLAAMLTKRPLSTLVFCVSVSHAKRMSEIFNRWMPGSSHWVGKGVEHDNQTSDEDRERIVRDFKAAKFPFLCNVAIFTEGTDIPGVEMVALGRKTLSRSLMAQMIGRGFRPHASIASRLGELETATERRALIAASDKASCVVLDFVGLSGKHDLVGPADVLGESRPKEVIHRANELLDEGETDLEAAMDTAQREYDLDREAEGVDEEMEAERLDKQDENHLLRNLVATSAYTTSNASFFGGRREPDQVQRPAPVSEVVASLMRYGVSAKTATGYSTKQAYTVLSKLKRERPSNGQLALLRSRSISEGQLRDLNTSTAKTLIDSLMREH